MHSMLIINPGSTSTKIGLFEDSLEVATYCMNHDQKKLAEFSTILDQYDFRRDEILKVLEENKVSLEDFDAFVGRGGLLHPMPSGTYVVDEAMIKDLKKAPQGEHASNLGGLLAQDFAKINKRPAYIADPVVVDELIPLARISGLKEIKRKSIFHALNHKAVGKRFAKENHWSYDELNLVIAHLGGGISVAAHEKGRVIDVNNALNGEGPFSPERAGTLPTGDLIKLCFSGDFTEGTLRKMITGNGGQGILSMGKFLAFGGMDVGLNVSWCPSYGPEMRGGTANCSVILSNEEIGAPIITSPDTIVVMNKPSLEKFEQTVKPGGLIILDSNLVLRDVTRDDVEVLRIPSQDEAKAIGSDKIANMVLLGALIGKTKVLKKDELLQALKNHGKEDFYLMNEKAIEKGIEYGTKVPVNIG